MSHKQQILKGLADEISTTCSKDGSDLIKCIAVKAKEAGIEGPALRTLVNFSNKAFLKKAGQNEFDAATPKKVIAEMAMSSNGKVKVASYKYPELKKYEDPDIKTFLSD